MINRDYLYEEKYKNIDELEFKQDCTYFFSRSAEYRSTAIIDMYKNKYPKINFIEIESIDNDIIIEKQSNKLYNLKSSNNMMKLISNFISSDIYIDTSGMVNRTIASLLRNVILLSIKRQIEIKVVYVEPYKYKIEQFKTEGVLNDLSEKFDGIKPFPGFANIVPNNDDNIFVIFLGFEGGRFTYLVEQIQPQNNKIIAIIGAPGFRIEYPFIALWGNRISLEETKSWENIRYVAANSLVDVFFLLNKLIKETPKNIKIITAPIGTKPHAIGAILAAINYPNRIEIVYDNPKRKMNRTDGTGQVIISNISALLRDS